jgi:rhodanese-related sulfurtransferase
MNRLFGGFGNPVPSLTVQETWERLSTAAKHETPFLLDVREVWEYQSGHARGAKNIPLSQIMRRIDEIPRDRDVFVICQSGNRSVTAVRVLQEAGVTRAFNVRGGTGAWRMHRLPLGS